MIISASRRTDIPAFYSDWFINRIKDEYLYIRNPFNHNSVKKISLRREDVDAIVFWTRNPEKLLNNLDILDSKQHNYYFQYTITGYSRILESNTPHPLTALEIFKKLSSKIGKEKVIWRFDPIIFSNITDDNEIIRLFEKIANTLNGYTNKVIISFYDNYVKSQTNLKKINNFNIEMPSGENLNSIVDKILEIGNKNNIAIETCSEDLSLLGIKNTILKTGKCIDDRFIDKLFGVNLHLLKDKNQRKECGCVQSVDIGTYNTCLHGCVYCYATHNMNVAINNFSKHDPLSPFLIPNPKDQLYINQHNTLF